MENLFTNKDYKLKNESYTKKDGFKAILLFILVIGTGFLHGLYAITTMNSSLSTNLIISIRTIFPILDILLVAVFIWIAKESLYSIGISSKNIIQSLAYGVFGGIILRIILFIPDVLDGKSKLHFVLPMLFSVISNIISTSSEEIVFRGYIQTRLSGLIKNEFLSSSLNGVFFVLLHYPFKWMVHGIFSLSVLTIPHIIGLFLLHFLCDFVHRKTNNLYGSIVLHFVYNILLEIIILS